MQGVSSGLLAHLFKEENILVDLCLHDKGTMARNHGTGFHVVVNILRLFLYFPLPASNNFFI